MGRPSLYLLDSLLQEKKNYCSSMHVMYKAMCAAQAVALYWVMTKEDNKDHPMNKRREEFKQHTMFSKKNKENDDFSKEQLGDMSLEELDKNIAALKKKRET